MASSHWFLFLILLVTIWYNLFISLRTEGCILSSQLPSLDREEQESLIDLLLTEESCIFYALAQIFNIFFNSWSEPEHLAILKSFFASWGILYHSATSFHTSNTDLQQCYCCLGYLLGLRWWTPGWTCIQIDFLRYDIHTFNKSSHLSCTAHINY